MQFSWTFQVCINLKIRTYTDAAPSNDCRIELCYSCEHSKRVIHQKVSKFCMDTFILLMCVPSVVYIPGAGLTCHMTLTRD